MIDKLAVIILNYNSYDDTLKLINSIEEYDSGLCIIVVDNLSEKEERQKLLAIKDRCILVLLNENGGYAAGNNVGIKKAIELGYETFLLANSDTYLISSHAISECYAYMKKNNIGILGPKMINESGEDISGCICVDKYGRTKHLFTENISNSESLVGAFLFIDKQVINKIGFIREFYFLYREETDYCVRACNNGIKIVYYPLVTIVHKSASTTRNVSNYYYHRNMFIFARENFKLGSLYLAFFYFPRFIFLSIKMICSDSAVNEKSRNIKQLWCAFFDGVRNVRGKKTGV